MDYLVAHEPKIHYPRNDVRTEAVHGVTTLAQLKALVARPQGLTIDCSQSCTLLPHIAGLHDPSNVAYHYDGNTQLMFDNPVMQHYVRAQSAQVGALVFFGIPGRLETQHVCMVRHPGEDPVLFSHGQEKGPLYLPFSVEAKAHVGTPVFLSIVHL